MEPLRYNLNQNPTLITNEGDVIGENYELLKVFSFIPDFLEPLLDDEANVKLKEYLDKKDKFKYIGTLKQQQKTSAVFIEYYFDENENIIAFLVCEPKNPNHYTSLNMVAIFEKEEDEVLC